MYKNNVFSGHTLTCSRLIRVKFGNRLNWEMMPALNHDINFAQNWNSLAWSHHWHITWVLPLGLLMKCGENSLNTFHFNPTSGVVACRGPAEATPTTFSWFSSVYLFLKAIHNFWQIYLKNKIKKTTFDVLYMLSIILNHDSERLQMGKLNLTPKQLSVLKFRLSLTFRSLYDYCVQ